MLLADDHPLTLEGLRAFLEPHLHSVGTVTDGRALVEAALRLKPDLIILDITSARPSVTVPTLCKCGFEECPQTL